MNKEIRLSLNIGVSDLDRKLKQMNEFLSDGHNVTLSIRLHGRQRANPQRAVDFLNEHTQFAALKRKTNGLPKVSGRSVSIMVMK